MFRIFLHFPAFPSQMVVARRPIDSSVARWATLILLVLGIVSFGAAYMILSVLLRPGIDSLLLERANGGGFGLERENGGGCCRGVHNLELWGSAVKWGTDHKFNSSEECCKACKGMCSGRDGPCLCDSWVFCGDKKACGPKFGECWLKKQKDTLAPERQDAGSKVMWTSGIIFGKGEGIVGLHTEHGNLHIKLHPDCAPHSVAYILELLALRHCAGCQFFRAEGRGSSWDSKGNHIRYASFGPPYAVIQGMLEPAGTTFKKIPPESFRPIRRGSVAWVGSGPEFFVSLANHGELKRKYTVFGTVLPEDMEVAEKIARLPTRPDVWNNINVTVLEKPVLLSIRKPRDLRSEM